MPTTMRDANLADIQPPKANPADRVLSLSHVFEVSRPLMWRLWTEGEHLRHWYVPRSMTIELRVLDVRPGGPYHLVLTDPDGIERHLRGEYREVEAPDRLVFGHRWDGELETLATVLFTDEGDGLTRVTLHQGVFGSRDQRDDHVRGWNSTLDHLAAYAARARG